MNLASGTALDTEFEVSVSGCEDSASHFPLIYSYSVQQTVLSIIQPLNDQPLIASSFSSVLSVGEYIVSCQARNLKSDWPSSFWY